MTGELEYVWDPSRQVISVDDPRLNMLLVRQPDRCATLTEYAQACGMDTAQVVECLGRYLDSGEVGLDFFGDEVFVNTGPQGRPAPLGAVDVAPNLWEQLRSRVGVEAAYALWRMIRSLERAGWTVEHKVARIMFGLGFVDDAPYLGVTVGAIVVPVMVFPSSTQLSGERGLLDQYEQAGARAVAVICDERGLDEMVTAVRRWVLSKRAKPALNVLVLESPRYNPTLLSPNDAAVEPVSITRDGLGNLYR
jgi:hypothetical protein